MPICRTHSDSWLACLCYIILSFSNSKLSYIPSTSQSHISAINSTNYLITASYDYSMATSHYKRFIMPVRDDEAEAELYNRLLKLAKRLGKNEEYKEQGKVFEELLSFDPKLNQNLNTFEEYLSSLQNLDDKQKIYRLFEYMLKAFEETNPRTRSKIYKKYVEFSMKQEDYETVKKIVKRSQIKHDGELELTIEYVRACSRSMKFHEGLAELERFEQKYRKDTLQSNSFSFWLVRLNTCTGNYEKALKYCVEAIEVKKLEGESFKSTKCQILVFLKRYEDAVNACDLIIKKSENKIRKLEAYAIRAYSYFKLNNAERSIATMKEALQCKKEEMITIKQILLYFMLTAPDQMHTVYKEQLLGKINYVIESAESDDHSFDDKSFSNQFFNFKELQKFMVYFKLFSDCDELIQYCLPELREYAQLVLLCLFEGNQFTKLFSQKLDDSRQNIIDVLNERKQKEAMTKTTVKMTKNEEIKQPKKQKESKNSKFAELGPYFLLVNAIIGAGILWLVKR